MFERYTDRARRVIVLTRQAAHDMAHGQADTGHLLAGLIGEGGGVAFQALTALGLTPERIRAAVLNRHPLGSAFPAGHVNLTPRLKKALDLALRESVARGGSFIATEHLLLGLIAEGGDVGALALAGCVNLPDVRAKVLELLGGYEKPAAAAPAILEQADGQVAATAFAEYVRRMGILGELTNQGCADLSAMFLHAFALGAGNYAWKARVAELKRDLGEMDADYLAGHGNDMVPVKLIDLASAVARMRQVQVEGIGDVGLIHERIFTCDLPRLEAYLPAGAAGLPEYDYPRTNSGPLCRAEETGQLDSTDVFCPFASDGKCGGGCPTNRERACILGEE